MAVDYTPALNATLTQLETLAPSAEPKDAVYIAKAIEALRETVTMEQVIDEGQLQVSNVTAEGNTQYTRVFDEGGFQTNRVTTEGDTQDARVIDEGNTQVLRVQTEGSSYAKLTGADFTGAVTGTDLSLSGYLRGPSSFTIDPAGYGDNTGKLIIAGDLQVDGTTTTINSETLTVTDMNVVIASGALDAAAANGAGFHVDGANASVTYQVSPDSWEFNKPVITPGMKVTGTTTLEDIKEKVVLDNSTTGLLTVNANEQGVIYLTGAQTANRTINFVGDGTTALDDYLATGQSVTVAVIATQGSTAYYFDALQADGVTMTAKWQGGYAPTAGNASGLDSYSFTIIKTGAGAFSVLAAQTQFA